MGYIAFALIMGGLLAAIGMTFKLIGLTDHIKDI
jgi:hypothetical protein